MRDTRSLLIGFGVAALTVSVSCDKSKAPEGQLAVAAGTGIQPIVHGNAPLSPAAKGDSGHLYTKADVDFMTGMISHHAQAVLMAGWAPTHGASAELQRLCERIVVGQRDEIALMRGWLHDHDLPVPDPTSTKMHMVMNGVEHDMLMPGMMTDEQMAALDKAHGVEFDRLFLEGMIRHHQGAITMVNTLFAANGAAQDETVFKFSNDVFADQTTEITRMTEMLAATPSGGHAARGS